MAAGRPSEPGIGPESSRRATAPPVALEAADRRCDNPQTAWSPGGGVPIEQLFGAGRRPAPERDRTEHPCSVEATTRCHAAPLGVRTRQVICCVAPLRSCVDPPWRRRSRARSHGALRWPGLRLGAQTLLRAGSRGHRKRRLVYLREKKADETVSGSTASRSRATFDPSFSSLSRASPGHRAAPRSRTPAPPPSRLPRSRAPRSASGSAPPLVSTKAPSHRRSECHQPGIPTGLGTPRWCATSAPGPTPSTPPA